jgi:hypothetical protein
MSAGPAFVIDTLLGQLDLDSVTIFSGVPERHPLRPDISLRTDAPVRPFDVPVWWPQEDRRIGIGSRTLPLRLRAIGNVAVGIRVAFAAARLLRQHDVRGLLVVYPKQHFLLGGCLAALTTKKPLFVYFMDVYVEGLSGARRIARAIERLVARRADVVFAMSEPHREHFEQRLRAYGGRQPRVVELPHPYADDGAADEEPQALGGQPSIVFTGAIYDAQAEGIRRLIEAIDLPELDALDPRLHVLTQTELSDLAALGIEPSHRVEIRAATRGEARAAQRAGDVLFLPIAFDAKTHVRRTASPSKMPEYLASGRPILVYAPPDAYLARYALERRFAEVVTEPNAGMVARALRVLVTDPARVAELRCAAEATLERHRAANVVKRLRTAVDSALATSDMRRSADGSAPDGREVVPSNDAAEH